MLEMLASKFTNERYNTGDMIVKFGEPGDKFYIIASGKVEVWVTGQQGQKARLSILATGDHFGEFALLAETPRTSNVQALTPCLILALERTPFTELMNQAPAFGDHLERVVQQRQAHNSLLLNGHGEKPIELSAAHVGEPICLRRLWTTTKILVSIV